MSSSGQEPPQKAVIASANPLFGRGLERLLIRNRGSNGIRVRLTSTLDEALEMMDHWNPDLVIVDYDDRNIQRNEFLNHFVSGEHPMHIMLVSLKASGAVVVYDRRTLTADQVDDWLSLAWSADRTGHSKVDPPDPQDG